MTEEVKSKNSGLRQLLLIIVAVGTVTSLGTCVTAYYRHQTDIVRLAAQSTHDAAELDVLRNLVERFKKDKDKGDATLDDVLEAREPIEI